MEATPTPEKPSSRARASMSDTEIAGMSGGPGWLIMGAMALHIKLPSAPVTDLLGQALASSLPPGVGVVLYLQGELGAGKTTLVRSLLRELGVAGAIKSPTYTLVENYTVAGREVAHVDLHRLSAQGAVAELALEE